jgi:CRISPR-associated protein Cmr3
MTTLLVASRDGLFPKDGRGWSTSASGRAHGLDWPFPSTLLGAIRTAWGREQERVLGRAFTAAEWKRAFGVSLGATLVLRRPVSATQPHASHRLWPVPMDALFMLPTSQTENAEIIRLDPLPPRTATLGREDDPAREALWRPELTDPRKPEVRPAWWPEDAFLSWLADPLDRARPRDASLAGLTPLQRTQTHVGIDPATGTAQDGLLFSHDIIEVLDKDKDAPGQITWHDWLIAAQVLGWDNPPPVQTATLAGDRRLVEFRVARDALFACPDTLTQKFEERSPRGLRLVVVTPLASKTGWLLPGLAPRADGYRGKIHGIADEVALRAALMGRPRHVSGWDLAKNAAKRTDRLVPPGAVYHLVKQGGGVFTGNEARALWLASVGERGDEGYGRIVPGLWQPKEEAA